MQHMHRRPAYVAGLEEATIERCASEQDKRKAAQLSWVASAVVLMASAACAWLWLRSVEAIPGLWWVGLALAWAAASFLAGIVPGTVLMASRPWYCATCSSALQKYNDHDIDPVTGEELPAIVFVCKTCSKFEAYIGRAPSSD